MPIVSDGHADLCTSIQAMLIDSLDAKLYEAPEQLAAASHLLVTGLGQWGNERAREALRVAGKHGVRRSLWQLETLPPFNVPDSIASRVLLRKTPDRVTRMARMTDKFALKRLSFELQRQEWLHGNDFEARRLGLPYREARRIRALWRDKLLDQVLVSLESRQRFLRSIGVKTTFVPLGYHPLWGRPLENEERELDAIFIGTPTPARAPQIGRLSEQLLNAGFRLTVVDRGCYGEQRTKLLNNTKILIHLRNYPWELTRMRMLMGMGCKALVVTEQFWDIKPFEPSTHFAMASTDNLAETIIFYLRNENERRAITERAFEFLSGELNLGKMLAAHLDAPADLGS